MKKISSITILLMSLIVVFIAHNNAKLLQNDVIEFSNIGSVELKFYIKKGVYQSGDLVSSIKDCSSVDFLKCITFDSTIIMIPKKEFLNNLEGEYFEGVNEAQNLSFNVQKINIKILGEKINGFLFNVGNFEVPYIASNQDESLSGTYFYSLDHGVLFYKHNAVELGHNFKKILVSELYWSKTMCGLFSISSCD